MINKTDILRLVHDAVHPSRSAVKRELFSPSRDWRIILIMFSVLVIGGSAWVATRYLTYQSADKLVGVEATQVPRYRQEQVLDALELFRAKNTKYLSLISDRPVLSEPTEEAIVSSTTETVVSGAEVTDLRTVDVVAE